MIERPRDARTLPILALIALAAGTLILMAVMR